MGRSTSTVLAEGADRGLGRTLAVAPFGPGIAVHAGVVNPDQLVGVRERVAVSGGGVPCQRPAC